MELLKRFIEEKAVVLSDDIIKVDQFLNHQIDPQLMSVIGDAFYDYFKEKGITKVLTIEASGIAVGLMTALKFNVPLVFAKKGKSKTLDSETYATEVFSYTKEQTYQVRVSKKFLNAGDRVLIVDDFLAMGSAALGLCDLCRQSGAEVKGIGIVVDKTFQAGRQLILDQGYDLYALARIASLSENRVQFEE